MAQQIQLRGGSDEEWTNANPTLLDREVGVETNTGKFKIGNGADSWNNLAYGGLSPVDTVSTNLDFTATVDPSVPPSEHMLFYAKSVAGRVLPKITGPSGVDTALQTAIWSNGIRVLSPGAGTAMSPFGMAAPTAVGTVAHPAPSGGGLRVQTRRATVTSATTANSAAELRNAVVECYRGDVAGLGGFYMSCRWSVSSVTANQRSAVGLFSVTTALATTTNPQSLLNAVFVGNGSSDTTLHMMWNDGSGTCSQLDLGSDFPSTNASAVYELVLFAAPNGSVINYRVQRLDVPAVVEGQLTTDIPANTQWLSWHAYLNNGGTASAAVLEVMRYYLETDY